MAKRSRVITMAPLVLDHEEDDLSFWEFVNPSDADYSDDSFSVDSLPDDVISLDSSSCLSPSPPQTLQETDGGDRVADLDLGGRVDDDHGSNHVDDGRERSWPEMFLCYGDSGFAAGGVYGYHGYSHDYDGGNDDLGYGDGDDDDDDGDDDLDDELVPRSVSTKLGRQRMRKLGKRMLSKVVTSKTSPYSHLKPGCVRGKHGLGMKFRC